MNYQVSFIKFRQRIDNWDNPIEQVENLKSA